MRVDTVVQCKRYISRSPNKNEIASFLNSAREHRPDSVLFITTSTLSPDVKDWTIAVKEQYPFDVYVWEPQDLHREILRNKSHLFREFPGIYGHDNRIPFYRLDVQNPHSFACDDFEEIEVIVRGMDSYEAAEQSFIEFIRFVKANGFVILREDFHTVVEI